MEAAKIPSKLIYERSGEDGNERAYLELHDGRKLPLPFHWREEEFALDGNLQILGDGKYFAVYDETTRTGAFFCSAGAARCWFIWQPCTRDDFYGRMVPGSIGQAEALEGSSLDDSSTQIGRGALEGVQSELPAG